MSNKSWAVTIVPLAVYLISFAYTLASGVDLTENQAEMLQTLFYGFLGAGTIGAAKSVLPKLK